MTPKKKYQLNQTKSIRFTSKFPQYCLDYLNDHDCGNNEILELLQLGIETKLKQSSSDVVDISPLFIEMDQKKIVEINQNYMLKKKFVELAEWFLFDKIDMPFQHYTNTTSNPEQDKQMNNEHVGAVDVTEGSLLDRTMQLLDEDDDDDE